MIYMCCCRSCVGIARGIEEGQSHRIAVRPIVNRTQGLLLRSLILAIASSKMALLFIGYKKTMCTWGTRTWRLSLIRYMV